MFHVDFYLVKHALDVTQKSDSSQTALQSSRTLIYPVFFLWYTPWCGMYHTFSLFVDVSSIGTLSFYITTRYDVLHEAAVFFLNWSSLDRLLYFIRQFRTDLLLFECKVLYLFFWHYLKFTDDDAITWNVTLSFSVFFFWHLTGPMIPHL